MIYYKKNKDKINKYQIDVDKKKLIQLEKDIMKNGSEVEHKIAECTENTFYGYTSNKNVRNIKRVKKIDKTIDDEPIYRYVYDELTSPLLDLTYLLYHEKQSVIDEIYGYENQLKKVKKEINKVNNKLEKTELGSKFNELLELMKKLVMTEKKLEKNMPYINKMKDLLTIKLLDTMDKKEIKKATTFLETVKPKYGKAKIKVK